MRLGQGFLVHYTNSLDVLLSIINEGFVFVPNKRNLMKTFLGDKWPPKPFHEGMIKDDPQEFGMVSFSHIARHEVTHYASQFGKYGIAVSWEWAAERGVERVIYVRDSGTVCCSFKWLFQNAVNILQANIMDPEDGLLHMSFENERIAAMIPGGSLYQNLLRLYEFMEPEENAHQREWRITNPEPDYSFTGDKRRDINMARTDTSKLGKKSLKLHPNDIMFIIAPWTSLPTLYWKLSKQFWRVEIIPVGIRSK